MPISTSKKKKLGSQIKKQRTNEKKTLRKVATECEISPASLSDIENGIIFPGEVTFLRLIKILNFANESEICDLYAELKETAPPDVIDFLIKNKAAIAEVRQLMNKEKEVMNQ